MFVAVYTQQLVPVAARCKAYVYGHSPAEIVGWNPTEGVLLLFRMLCIVGYRSPRRAITRLEESCRRLCIVACHPQNSRMARDGPQCHTTKKSIHTASQVP
jgi:hypothetical protein